MSHLADFIAAHPDLLVITGAGCSAPSGIPTYRNDAAEWQRSAPIQHKDFLSSPQSRKRYWARSFAGWPAVAEAQPNVAHLTLAALEREGAITALVTQNVDGLHQKAGHRKVFDLHGRLDSVICLGCGRLTGRATFQERLRDANPILQPRPIALTPDGDAEVDDAFIERMRVPDCENCHGILKPNVVFYGGAVDRQLVERVYQLLDGAGGLLIVGSSLMVFSAFRFARHAARDGKPIAIVNRGITRADNLASLKVSVDCETAFAALGSFSNNNDTTRFHYRRRSDPGSKGRS